MGGGGAMGLHTFFSKLVGQGQNMAVTIMGAIFRLSHGGVGQRGTKKGLGQWDSTTKPCIGK